MTRRLGLGDVLAGRFQLVADVGEGGMGRVFEALDLRHDRSAAVKVIYRRLAHDPEFRTRFAREAEAAERANHPHVLPVWSYGEEDGHLYLVTPLCDTDLAGLIEDRGPLEVTRALSVTSQVAWALDWAHGRDIVHRDVKPENILLVAGPAEPHAYLGDFGLAKVASNATLTRHGTAAGLSPAYAAPEQWRADRVTPATDQYALAGTLYCCLTGHPPFWPLRDTQALQDAHLEAEPPPAEEPANPAAARVLGAVRRGLAKDPDDRYASCGALIAAARYALADRPVETAGTVADAPAGADDTDPEHPFSARRGRERPPLTRARADAPAVATADDGAPPSGGGTGVAAPASAPEGGGHAAVRRRRTGSLLAALGALVALGVVAALLLGGDEQKAGGIRVLPAVAAGARPTDAVAVGGTVWVANGDDGTLSPFDARTGRRAGEDVRALSNGFRLAAAGGTLWTIASSGRDVLRVDTQATPPVTTTRQLDADPYDIAADRRGAWIIAPGASRRSRAGRLIALDLVTGAARPAVPTAGEPTAVAAARGAVWVLEGGSGIVESVEASAGRVRGRPIRVDAGSHAITTDGRWLWVASPRRRLLRIDPGTRAVKAFGAPAGGDLVALAAGGGAIWWIDKARGLVSRIDTATGQVRAPVRVGPDAGGAAVAGGALWVTTPSRNAVARLRL